MAPSIVQKVKKTLRQRSKSSESNANRKKPGVKGSEIGIKEEIPSKNTKIRGAVTNRKKQKKSSRSKNLSKSVSKETINEPRSRMSKLEVTSRSIDLEEDPEPMGPTTPDPAPVADSKKEDPPKKTESKMEEVKEKPPSDRKNQQQQQQKKAKTWVGMEAAMKFFNNNNKVAKLRAEYALVESIACNKTTGAFDANTQRNREGAPKIYDDNRVVLNRPGHEDVNYINASFISVKDFPHKLIIAQLPRMENESFVEDFWQMIYQEQVTLVYVLVPSEVLRKAPTPLFKEGHGEYEYVGKMFINNRRSQAGEQTDANEYTIEVLPEGNSDSVMCQVHHLATWQHLQQPPKTRPIIKMIHQFLTEKEIQTAGVCVVSVFGSGRACSFIGALIAINQLNKGIEPNIGEIMTNIKQQRPGATESFAQYAGIYAIVLDYISRKRGNKSDPNNKELNLFVDELIGLSPPSSPK
ncbi:unnamed protein product [Caenorhabditis sp. 36 PRJEB53466]|nr:unnamed protein product [Caenorhabditis sp. 36 PRJEB53466]